MLNNLRFNQRGPKPSLPNPLPEIDHDQVSGRLLGQLEADRRRGGFDPVGLTTIGVVISALQAGQGIEFFARWPRAEPGVHHARRGAF